MNFDNPVEAQKTITAFLKHAHRKVEDEIVGILTPLTGQTLTFREDSYLGYPRVYSEDAHCSIPELKRLSVRNGRLHLTMGHRSALRVPHADQFSTSELLQIWDIALNEINSRELQF